MINTDFSISLEVYELNGNSHFKWCANGNGCRNFGWLQQKEEKHIICN